MRLYHVPDTRSTRAVWLLEEFGEPYSLTIMDEDECHSERHSSRHPWCGVPVLEEDEGFVIESAAICLHLADLHPDSRLIPDVGTHDRALVYQWTTFALTELEVPYLQVLTERRESQAGESQEGDLQRDLALLKRRAGGETLPPYERFRTAAAVVEMALQDRDYLVGASFSVCDVICGSVLFYASDAGLIDGLPNIAGYLNRLEDRPARQRARAITV